MGQLFTIGHSKHDMEYFITLLKKFDINFLIDVRSTPYSKYAEQFNKDNLYKELQTHYIRYAFMGKYFGARMEDPLLYHDKGYLDFEKVRQSKNFNIGMKNVITGLNKGNRIALMCTEKDPIDCHRAIMIARGFDIEGIDVKHILSDGNIQTQKELDDRLLNYYFPNRYQITLFSNENDFTESQYIREAYCKRNEEIGYRMNKDSYEK